MPKQALGCIVCKKELTNVWDDLTNQPSSGTRFTSYGHYGSGTWDPVDGSSIEINICDKCLIELGEAGMVLQRRNAILLVSPRDSFLGMVQVDSGAKDEPSGYTLWDPHHYEDGPPITVNSLQEFDELASRRDRFDHPRVKWAGTTKNAREILKQDLEPGSSGEG